jgi:hypothetical protein
MMNPIGRIEMVLDLGRAGLIGAELAWDLFYMPVDGSPTPPMPEAFRARWEELKASDQDWDDVTR